MPSKHLLSLMMLFASFSISANQDFILKVVTEHSPPFNYQLKNKQIVGTATDKVIRALNEANIKFTHSLYPWARSYKLALTQPNTLIYSIYRNKQREHLFQWVCPLVLDSDLYLFALKKKHAMKTLTTENLALFKTGIVRGGLGATYLQAHGLREGKELYSASNDDINLKLLLNEKIDFIIGTIPSLSRRMKNMNMDVAVFRRINFPEINKNSERCMAFSLDTPSYIVDKVRIAIQQINKQ